MAKYAVPLPPPAVDEYKSLVESFAQAVWETDPYGQVVTDSPSWRAYTGQSREQWLGEGWVGAIHPDDQVYAIHQWQEAIDSKRPVNAEFRLCSPDRGWRWTNVRATRILDADGAVTKWVGLNMDIDDRMKAQQLLQQQQTHLEEEVNRRTAQLQQADRRKDEFLAMLAHELRNPMATIRNGLTILDLTSTDETTHSIVDLMSRQTDHLVHMLDDLLDVSRISRGKIELKPERVNLVSLVQQAVDSVRSLYQQQGRSLHVEIPPLPIYLSGDATRIVQVVTNLLTNGARYTGEQGTVWLRLDYQDGEAILQVRDNGIGLSADQLSSIFELFVQVDNSLARANGGLGLGLTLVKRLVELHGGRVVAQSAGLAKGSTFTVYLPALPVAPAGPTKPLIEPLSEGGALCLLVIDDNPDVTLTLSMLLKLKGYEVHTRNSGRAGIEAAEALQPLAILLDIGMPEQDGYVTCQLIREQAWGRDLVVIALTGYGQEEDRQRTRESGFDGHLVKPVDLGTLIKMLTDLVDKVGVRKKGNMTK